MYMAGEVGFEPTVAFPLAALEAAPFGPSGTPLKMRSQLLAYSSYATLNGLGALPLPLMPVHQCSVPRRAVRPRIQQIRVGPYQIVLSRDVRLQDRRAVHSGLTWRLRLD